MRKRTPLAAFVVAAFMLATLVLAVLVLVTALLGGCAALPDESPLAEPEENHFWQGTWLIDDARLAPPSPTARALATGLAETVRYELTAQRLRRVVAGEITDHPLAVRRAGPDDAEFLLLDGRTIFMRREGDAAVLIDGAIEHPLRRAD